MESNELEIEVNLEPKLTKNCEYRKHRSKFQFNVTLAGINYKDKEKDKSKDKKTMRRKTKKISNE